VLELGNSNIIIMVVLELENSDIVIMVVCIKSVIVSITDLIPFFIIVYYFVRFLFCNIVSL